MQPWCKGLVETKERRFLSEQDYSDKGDKHHNKTGRTQSIITKTFLSTRMLEGENPPCGDNQGKSNSHRSTSTE